MHIVTSCAYDIIFSTLKTRSEAPTITLNRFLLASACSSHSTQVISAPADLTLKCCSSYLHGKQFPSILNKTTSLHIHTFTYQNLSSHYVVGIRLFYLEPVRNAVKI